MSVKVSVILPTHNRAGSLRRSCESVLNQSFRDLELLVVDDASTEDIAGLVREIGDDRIRYIRRERNGGASAARNTGLAAARGDYIAFQDSDDVWLPGKLAAQLARLESLPRDVGAVTGAKILYGVDHARNYGPGRVSYAPAAGRWLRLDEDQIKRFLVENRISLQNALFRRDCYPEKLWFDPRAKANADWEFTVRLAQHTRILEETEPVVLAYVSDDSISLDWRKKISGALCIINKNKALFRANRRELSVNMLYIGKMLLKANKRKYGVKLIVKSVVLNPRNTLSISYSFIQKLNLIGKSISLREHRRA